MDLFNKFILFNRCFIVLMNRKLFRSLIIALCAYLLILLRVYIEEFSSFILREAGELSGGALDCQSLCPGFGP